MGGCLSAKTKAQGEEESKFKEKPGKGYHNSETNGPGEKSHSAGSKRNSDSQEKRAPSNKSKGKQASSGSGKSQDDAADGEKQVPSPRTYKQYFAGMTEATNGENTDDGRAPLTPKAPGTPKAPATPREGTDAVGQTQSSSSHSSTLASYTLNELSAATDGFNQGRKLGEGGFGSVYWGELELEDGKGNPSPVAIKILNEDGLQGHKEWLAEVTLLGTLRHPHLVRLLGWCAEGTSRLLVYEYMPNGSLDVLLHPLPGSQEDVPPWGLRMEIALGVAKCLEYLHEGRDRPIIYRDLKSANVLLDHDYKPKLADFGLAKDGPVGDKTHVTTQVVGTHGYADPDYIITGHLTPKSDVYGFGVLMLELITGRHALNDEEEEGMTDASGMGYDGEEEDLAEWAVPYLDDRRRIVEIVDRRIAGSVPQRGLVKAALLARQCINDSPYERPQMSSIVKTLLSIQHQYQWPPTENSS